MENVGRLTPGACYIYEKADGITYAREVGDPPNKRFAIGWDNQVQEDLAKFHKDALWANILREAERNPALQEALDRAKVIYELSRQDQPVDHHPV